MLIWNYFRTHVKKWLNTLVIRNSKTKFKLEKASQRVNQNVNDFAVYLNNLYAQFEDSTSKVVKMQYLQIKHNEKICQKVQRFNIKYNNITQIRENYIDIKYFCDCYISCRINSYNRKISRSIIEIKIKHFRADEIIHLM